MGLGDFATVGKETHAIEDPRRIDLRFICGHNGMRYLDQKHLCNPLGASQGTLLFFSFSFSFLLPFLATSIAARTLSIEYLCCGSW